MTYMVEFGLVMVLNCDEFPPVDLEEKERPYKLKNTFLKDDEFIDIKELERTFKVSHMYIF